MMEMFLSTKKQGKKQRPVEKRESPNHTQHNPRKKETPSTQTKEGEHIMEEKEEKENKKKQKHHHHHLPVPKPKKNQVHQQQPAAAATPQPPKPTTDAHFKPSADVKGIRFGGQFIVRSFTVRRAAPLELLRLLDLPDQSSSAAAPFPSTTTYLPTNFTILAHHAWHTLTLGLGTKKSKVVVFVFESEAMKAAVDRAWPPMIPLGEVNRKLIRGLSGCEMARFKFRKGALTFYVYAARRVGGAAQGFSRAEDLRRLLESVVALTDFVDHTAMLAMPAQRSISFSPPVAVAH